MGRATVSVENHTIEKLRDSEMKDLACAQAQEVSAHVKTWRGMGDAHVPEVATADWPS